MNIDFSKPEILISFLSAIISIISLIITSILNNRTLNIQKQIGLTPIQKEYLHKKIERLEFAKNEILAIKKLIPKDQELNQENLTTNIALYANELLNSLPNIIEEVNIYLDNYKLSEINQTLIHVSEYVGKMRYNKILNIHESVDDSIIDKIFKAEEEFYKILNHEIRQANKQMENTIEMNY